MTGQMIALDGGQLYHRMAPVTAVINPYFKGVRVFSDEVYRLMRSGERLTTSQPAPGMFARGTEDTPQWRSRISCVVDEP